MTENDNIQELEEMRLQLGELKSMLKEQTIVNERMMRKAMKGKYNKVRNEIKFSIVFAFLAMPFMAWLLPTFGLPMLGVGKPLLEGFGKDDGIAARYIINELQNVQMEVGILHHGQRQRIRDRQI